MDDSCAVCAETLEWVAYGPCGHREVCSTCVARLRFICNDRRCCICKTDCNVVFVTKANGLLTRIINDFSVLPPELREGRVGSYWYHEDTQAFFDDSDHYKMIKAMCKLSCGVCDKLEGQSNDGPKKRGRFRNIEQLKGHLFHQHRLLMCSLCLEGRKVFICEQKLYTRAQLNKHVDTGDSEVDGTESERGGFAGHPMCEFCRTPFYGDNELYTHMSTEHYTCHICQRQHPGQYEYYKNYDDLEIHFRHQHFLCEDDACLAKKFVVFPSEAEMKRHNTIEHGGRMSRSKRNAALQIPTSFRYRSHEQENRRGRGRTFRRDSADNLLSMAIQASLETATSDGTFGDLSSTNIPVASDFGDTNDSDPISQPFESLAITDAERTSRYLQAVSQNSRNGPLEESSFPPLPLAPGGSNPPTRHDSEGLPKNTMAAHLRRKNNRKVTVHNTAQAWPAPMHARGAPLASSVHNRPPANAAPLSPFTSSQNKAVEDGPATSSFPSSANLRPVSVQGPSSSRSVKSLSGSSRITHSSSAPNLVESGSFDSSLRDFPPVTETRKLPSSNQTTPSINDVQTANKSLVEKMRAALQFDEDKYSAFKVISGEYRQGLMDTGTYLAYVEQFGLSHLVLELARLCPDVQKQKELVEIYNARSRSSASQGNGWRDGTVQMKGASVSKKGKGKSVEAEASNRKDNLADSVLTTVRKLQSGYKPSEDEVEVLSKDGYRTARGKSKVVINEPQAELDLPGQSSMKLKGQNDSQSAAGGRDQNSGEGGGRSKQRKKTSKFLRARLGDGSVASLLDLRSSDPEPDSTEPTVDGQNNRNDGLPARSVWRNGGGQRLVAMTSRDPRK